MFLCIKDITTHVIYHGMLHDKSKQDPQFLYDLLKQKIMIKISRKI